MKDEFTVAIDFDGVLCEDYYPNIGPARPYEIEMVKKLRAKGVKVILWTCRRGGYLEEAIEWCEEHGLRFDAINANLKSNIVKYGGDTRKVSANIYIDDRAIAHKPNQKRLAKLLKDALKGKLL